MITFRQKGDFSKLSEYLEKANKGPNTTFLDKYGTEGVAALSSATPVETGLTASSWNYEIKTTKKGFSIVFNNKNINNGVPIAVILQYGHGTKNGGYVQGIDYINPAIQPIFEKIAEEAWKEVTAL